ncbi:Uncharacterised protein [Mycobacteroides abscessus subsp. abscessus]|nr:Uncharacterised protein [Mycobacteroides abscessus subsp. abscessus]SKV00710.1 Uncharacterised protein [Mycobacteroides abscessus subsp. abscessus]
MYASSTATGVLISCARSASICLRASSTAPSRCAILLNAAATASNSLPNRGGGTRMS